MTTKMTSLPRFAICPGDSTTGSMLTWPQPTEVASTQMADSASCNGLSHFRLISDAMCGFYLAWSVLYFLWIFWFLGKYIEEKQYQTLWDRVLKMGTAGKLLSGLLQRYPKILVQGVYLLIHLLYSLLTMCVSALMFKNQAAHFAWLVAICFGVAYNGADFYLKLLAPLYRGAVLTEVDVVDTGSSTRSVVGTAGGAAPDPEPRRSTGETQACKIFVSSSMGVQRALSGLAKASSSSEHGSGAVPRAKKE